MEDSHLRPTTTMRGGCVHTCQLSPRIASPSLRRYQDVLVCMMDSVVKKMLLHHNINELREIDDDAVDDDVSEGKVRL